MPIWNPWHGCHKISPGCLNCYMYRRDAQFDKDSSIVTRTADFDLPLRRRRDGSYRLAGPGTVWVCMTSDFFVEEADPWRAEIWEMIRLRPDLSFSIITKRIERFSVGLPDDWGAGYPHVTVYATCENQTMADKRLPVLLELPIAHRRIVHEPMLEEIHIERYLESGKIESVICGGESGPNARVCDYGWILSTREQCLQSGVPFFFKQTGANFRKDGRIYHVPRRMQMAQARKAGIHTNGRKPDSSDG